MLQARTALAATCAAFVLRKLCIWGMNENFVIPSRLRSQKVCRELSRNQLSLSEASAFHKTVIVV